MAIMSDFYHFGGESHIYPLPALETAQGICYNVRNQMKDIPETSTTLLRDIASDAKNARWGEFVARYRPMMAAYLKANFPSLEADDIVQDTLVALVAVLPHYRYAPDETGHFHNYLTGILRNKALKQCRKLVREAAIVENKRLRDALDSQSQGSDYDDNWRRAVMEIAVRQLLADDQIHEHSKQIFQRLTVDGMSPDSAAAAYGVSRNSVDKIKSRMLERLRGIVRSLMEAGDV